MMKRIIRLLVLGGISMTLLLPLSCSRVAFTGRKQLNLVSDAEVTAMGLQSFQTFMATAKASAHKPNTLLVKTVGQKLSNAVSNYMKANNMGADLENYAWEFHLVQDEQANAFCMPGGKIVFYDGIMPYCNTETYVAVVMSHEIAHAIAKHAQERMSQAQLVETGAGLLGQTLSGSSAKTQSIASMVYGLGANVGVILPYSRTHEIEADRLGLIFMAIAGYDVQKTVDFWVKMSNGKAQEQPEFLSTHPAGQTRIEAIKKHIPEALKYKK